MCVQIGHYCGYFAGGLVNGLLMIHASDFKAAIVLTVIEILWPNMVFTYMPVNVTDATYGIRNIHIYVMVETHFTSLAI